MNLVFTDPVELTGAVPEGTISLRYSDHCTLELRCVDTEGNPIDMAALGYHQWKVRIVSSVDESFTLAQWNEDLPVGCQFNLVMGMYDPRLFCYLSGRPEYPAVMQLRAYSIIDSEASIEKIIKFPCVLLRSDNIRTIIDIHRALLIELSAAVDGAKTAELQTEAIRDSIDQSLQGTLTGVAIDGVLQPVVDRVVNLNAATGDMRKSVYDTNDDGIVDEAEVAEHVPWDGIVDKPGLIMTVEELPTPSAEYLNTIVMRLGDERMYKCVQQGIGYYWRQIYSDAMPVDDHMDTNSTNPVQNKVITESLEWIQL